MPLISTHCTLKVTLPLIDSSPLVHFTCWTSCHSSKPTFILRGWIKISLLMCKRSQWSGSNSLHISEPSQRDFLYRMRFIRRSTCPARPSPRGKISLTLMREVPLIWEAEVDRVRRTLGGLGEWEPGVGHSGGVRPHPGMHLSIWCKNIASVVRWPWCM